MTITLDDVRFVVLVAIGSGVLAYAGACLEALYRLEGHQAGAAGAGSKQWAANLRWSWAWVRWFLAGVGVYGAARLLGWS